MSYHNNITFTELTQDDIQRHEDLYIELLLVNNADLKDGAPFGCYKQRYTDHAIIELQKANDLFVKMFT